MLDPRANPSRRGPRPLPPIPQARCYISRLPNELLTLILTVHRHLDWTTERLPFLLLASCISRRFRTLVLGTPSLWTSIGYRLSRPATFQQDLLERSKPYSFDIILKADREMPNIDIFISHLHRCRRLSIEADSFECAYDVLFDLRHESARLLEDLVVDVNTDGMDEGQWGGHIHSLLSGGAPLLSFIALRGISLCPFNLPLRNVRTLELRSAANSDTLPFHRFRDTLVASPKLSHLVLDRIPLEFTFPNCTIQLPSLRSIDYTSGRSTTPVSAVSAPSIDSLILRAMERSLLIDLFSTTPPIHPTLRYLHLELGYSMWRLKQDLDFGHWAQCLLDCFPSLINLTVTQQSAAACTLCGDMFDVGPIVHDGHLDSVTDLLAVFASLSDLCHYCDILWNGL